jgi:PIN domain nuclease of toxin-antitoxin system
VIILDTHVWVRWLDPLAAPLPSWLIDKIESADRLAVSAVTCHEVAWLNRGGQAEIPHNSQLVWS